MLTWLMTQMLPCGADMVGLIILRDSVFFFPTFCDLLLLLTAMAHKAGLCDSTLAQGCEGRGYGGCGVTTGRGTVDALSRCRC